MFDIESIKDGLVQGWIAAGLTLGVTWLILWGIYGLLYAFGKESLLTPGRRKFFYGIGTVFVFGVLVLIQIVVGRLRDIAAASPAKGRLKAGLILLSPLPMKGTNQPPTNTVPTMSGIGVPDVKYDDKGVNMLLVAKVDNSGLPTVAWNWKISVLLPVGGSPIPATIPSVFIQSTEPLPTVMGPYYVKMEDQLIQAMAVNPLPTGAGKIGWLVFNVAGFNEMPNGAIVKLSFEDVFGRETTLEHKWEKSKKEP